jgi:hypothetical protein
MEAEKGEASDAFKRAAVKWGIGRFLYDLPEMRLKVAKSGKSYQPADEQGNALYGKEKLSEYCNSRARKASAPAQKAKTETPSAIPKDKDKTPPSLPKVKDDSQVPTQSKEALPKMSAEEKTRMGRIYNFVRDNLANGRRVEPKDLAAVVFLALGRWPQNPADEELIINHIQIEEVKGLTCESDGKQLSEKVA